LGVYLLVREFILDQEMVGESGRLPLKLRVCIAVPEQGWRSSSFRSLVGVSESLLERRVWDQR
jgi:hypothetical protein